MKTIIASILIAIVFFAGALVARRQARVAGNLADAHLRLATLQHRGDDAIAAGEAAATPGRWQLNVWQQDEQRHRAAVTYWLRRYDELTPWLSATGAREVKDSELLFAAANAAFRNAELASGDRAAAVERLDSVVQAYATLLRLDPSHDDAAYNYEFVARVRDALARNRPRAKPLPPEEAGYDLPRGVTVHGRPGAPPIGIKGDEFKTLTPMRFDEREESNPGRGSIQRRRG